MTMFDLMFVGHHMHRIQDILYDLRFLNAKLVNK